MHTWNTGQNAPVTIIPYPELRKLGSLGSLPLIVAQERSNPKPIMPFAPTANYLITAISFQ
jgi:hypothetical protein